MESTYQVGIRHTLVHSCTVINGDGLWGVYKHVRRAEVAFDLSTHQRPLSACGSTLSTHDMMLGMMLVLDVVLGHA